MRLDCRSMEFEYFPFDPVGYKLVLLDTVVKHELVGSPYNRRRESCERVAKMLGQEFLRGATMERLDAIRDEISDEDYRRARFVIGEERRVLDVCDALQRGDYATVGGSGCTPRTRGCRRTTKYQARSSTSWSTWPANAASRGHA